MQCFAILVCSKHLILQEGTNPSQRQTWEKVLSIVQVLLDSDSSSAPQLPRSSMQSH